MVSGIPDPPEEQRVSDNGPPKPGPNQPAENWGRRDSIRAGAVSGPWRSGPRATPPAAPPPLPPRSATAALPPRPTQAAQVPLPPPRLTPAAQAPAPQPSQSPKPAVTQSGPVLHAPAASRQQARTAAPLPARGRRPLVLGITGGLAAAIAIFAGALVLRPGGRDGTESTVSAPGQAEAPAETAGTAPAGAAPAAPESASAPAANPPSPEDVAALSGITEIRLRLGPGFPESRRDTLVDALDKAGLKGLAVETVPVAVAASRVGYYLPGDREAAEALARLVAPYLGGRSINTRDYQGLMPTPVAGRLDLWISN